MTIFPATGRGMPERHQPEMSIRMPWMKKQLAVNQKGVGVFPPLFALTSVKKHE